MGHAARVSIIDAGSSISSIPTDRLMAPVLDGFGYMPKMPSLSFLVESANGKKILFDLGIAKDWRNFAPIISNRLKTNGYEIDVNCEVPDVLQKHHVDLSSIHSVVWSHWHWDHIGDLSKFPPTTELVVGPGFTKAFLPAYPECQDSPIRISDVRDRQVNELDFTRSSIHIGRFRAIDFFGDGSFYLLDTPGHAIGHLGGLARTTVNPDTFIFMGGDLCHHASELRPSKYIPLPDTIEYPIISASLYPCPGAVIERLQRPRGRCSLDPIFDPARGVPLEDAIETVRKTQELDADENVLFIYAHDKSVTEIGDLFPLAANDWKKHGWRDRMFWAFLRDFNDIIK
ncbi:hypothetical protein PFICI_09549 [Pestalotiopsis fici W106-1]|uniref:Metallo-beta-lactamase domain-containing protein n=1 Tax=Pestalotiopsis fici (strain W106-1 / CGMCC3.15140) TaxID=1229662 RepID=W3X3H8_PESFW|nr:uncharacterized protein PFICI_09549 [Pestalotiopsis fici W106-1]ETS79696.1 hypothetical protein PFICI_09549 [Pestalotiopsis fici W106-1]